MSNILSFRHYRILIDRKCLNDAAGAEAKLGWTAFRGYRRPSYFNFGSILVATSHMVTIVSFYTGIIQSIVKFQRHTLTM